MAVFENAPKSVSMVSITTRLAPTASMAAPSRRNRPSRSQSPVSSISRAGDVDVVDHELAVGLELREVEAQRRHVGDEVVGRLLEGHEHAGLAELGDPADEELHGEQRLAAAGRAADERRAAPRQPAAGHLVEPADAGRRLRQRAQPHPCRRSCWAGQPRRRPWLARAASIRDGRARGWMRAHTTFVDISRVEL